jgi:succinate-semialdehyde dehydrogenase / glutarate-semialdehyde dehydrogenase
MSELNTTEQTLNVRNPRTGQYDYTLHVDLPSAVRAIAETLRQHSASWSEKTVDARCEVLGRWRAALVSRRSEIINALIVDTGRVRESEMEFDAAVNGIARWVARAPALLTPAATKNSVVPPLTLTPAPVPLGVVAVISPWNFPLLLALIDAVPALAAGCTVMIKPSEITPRFIVPFVAALTEVPELASVLHIVTGGPATGAAMIDHADCVCFTGSVPTGRLIARHAAERLIPCFLELGGKDAAIVLADADIEHAARAIAWGGLANAGQSCLSIERVFVEQPVFEAFTAALVRVVSRLRLCHPDPHVGEIGPLIAARQADTIAEQLADAYALGATALTGGSVETIDGGLWCKPTVLVNVTPEMRIMTEETFGPVLPVMACRDAAHALLLANSTEFGLSGAVFGSPALAAAVALGMQCGAISINDCALTAIVHDGEKQAFKQSGLGPTRMGDASIARFLKRRVLIENPISKAQPWWFAPPANAR